MGVISHDQCSALSWKVFDSGLDGFSLDEGANAFRYQGRI